MVAQPSAAGKATRASSVLLHAPADHPRLAPGTPLMCTTASLAVDKLVEVPPGPACFVGVMTGSQPANRIR
eukprot:scaffold176922_cov26-Tisochrysis_lutea.AAC.2